MAANQGSRGGLITWTVVTSIIALASVVMAIYFYVDSNRTRERAEAQAKAVGEVVTPELMRSMGEAIQQLKDAQGNPDRGFNSSMKLFDVALAERNELAKLIAGGEDDSKALAAAKSSIEKAKAAGAQFAGEPSLAATVDALVTRVDALKTESENNKNDSAASKAKLDQTLAATEKQINTINEAMGSLRTESNATLAKAQQTSDLQTTSFNSTAEDLRKQLAAAQESINQLNTQNGDQGSQIVKLNIELKRLRDVLGTNRVDAAKAMTRQPDGRILRVPGQNRLFIDLGSADHINPGLTFEVYDQIEGVPAAGDPSNDKGLPVGKASIEVINVLPTSAECRITRQTYGTTITEGDLIVNLVYDRNTHYKFVVYGNFDLDQNGVATPADADVIKRLITQWGGEVTNEIDVDTDFVVLGKEPVIPDKPAQDEPLAIANYNAALAASDAYAEISQKAREYRLPILNQNRFLYLVGYYNQAKR